MKPVPVLPRPPFAQVAEIAVGLTGRGIGRPDELDVAGVVDRHLAAVGCVENGSGLEKSMTTAVGGAGTLSRVLVPAGGRQLEVRLLGADDRRAVARCRCSRAPCW